MPAIRLQVDREPGSKIGKEQRRFNKLVKDLTALRERLAEWRTFLPELQQRVATELEPLEAGCREARIELAMALHDAATQAGLGKRERAKVVEILLWHLTELLDEAADDALVALHDQHAAVSYQEQLAAETDMPQDLVDLGLYEDDVPLSLKELAEQLAQQFEHDGEAATMHDPDERHAGERRNAGRGESLGEKLARGAGVAVRQIYRKLASELHPDREADEAVRARKTELMQEANRAYAAEDLLGLLGLQLQVEQTTPDALSGMSFERLREFTYLLERQCQAARDELWEVTALFPQDPFAPKVSPDLLLREFQRDLRHLKRQRDEWATEAGNIRDARYLKQVLKSYRMGDLTRHDDFFEGGVYIDEPPPPKRRRR